MTATIRFCVVHLRERHHAYGDDYEECQALHDGSASGGCRFVDATVEWADQRTEQP